MQTNENIVKNDKKQPKSFQKVKFFLVIHLHLPLFIMFYLHLILVFVSWEEDKS